MRPYLRVLGKPDFRRLWTGATVSTLGDGMTLVALSWLVLARPGVQLRGVVSQLLVGRANGGRPDALTPPSRKSPNAPVQLCRSLPWGEQRFTRQSRLPKVA